MVERYKGFLLVLISSIGFGTLGLWGKMAYQLGMTPLEVLFLRYALAAVILWIVAFIHYRAQIKISPLNISRFFVQGGLFYALPSIGYFYALRYLPVSIATILFFLHPIYTFFVTSTLLKQKISGFKWVALLMTIVGIMLLIGINPKGLSLNMTGVYLMLMAGVGYAVYTLSNQIMAVECNGFIAAMYNITFCAMTMAVFLVGNGTGFQFVLDLTFAKVGIVLGMSVFGTIVGIMLLIQGIRVIGAAEASVYTVFEPLSATLLAAIFLGERLGIVQLAGVVCVIAGVSIIQMDRRFKRQSIMVVHD